MFSLKNLSQLGLALALAGSFAVASPSLAKTKKSDACCKAGVACCAKQDKCCADTSKCCADKSADCCKAGKDCCKKHEASKHAAACERNAALALNCCASKAAPMPPCCQTACEMPGHAH